MQNSFGFSSATTLSQAISIGEKLLYDRLNKFSAQDRNLSELLNSILKSVCLNMIKLSDLGIINDEIYHEILLSLDLFNDNNLTTDKITQKINTLTNYDRQLQLQISENLISKFGNISKTIVSHSSRKGKAILVSGNNFLDLLEILKQTKSHNIDVYTNSNLLIAHAFKTFSDFKNLVGHYGDSTENCILDFATFPGAILITANSYGNNEYLYRGRLFSSDYIIPKGVQRVSNYDYEKVILSAETAKGFSKGKKKPNSIIGFDYDEVLIKFSDIATKLLSGKYERLYIIGTNPHSETKKAYFDALFSKLKRNEFVISFSYEFEKENVYTINVGNYVPLVTVLLKDFFTKYPIQSSNIIFFYTTCDVISISSSIFIKNAGAKNVYITDCSPTIVNPSAFGTYLNYYNIKKTTDLLQDLKQFRKTNKEGI